MRRLAMLSLSIFCLFFSALIGFHLGSRVAVAQEPEVVAMSVSANGQLLFVIDSRGDTYINKIRTSGILGDIFFDNGRPAFFIGNVFTGSRHKPNELKATQDEYAPIIKKK